MSISPTIIGLLTAGAGLFGGYAIASLVAGGRSAARHHSRRRPNELDGEESAIKAARLAEEKYRLIFENAIEGIFQTTPSGRYLSANPRLAKIYGYDSPDALMHCLQNIQQQLYVESGRRDEFVRLMERQDEIRDFESQIRRRDDSIIWISENARAIRSQSGELLYYEGTVEDITDRKHAAALAAEKEAAVAASRAKSAFLAHMSHEIRTPLNGVVGMLQLLTHTPLDARQIRYIQIARSSADNLLAIINDVLDFSKIEAGKLELEILPFNLHDLLEEVTEMFSHRAIDKGLELFCRTTPDVPAAVRGDAQRLRQVLINLLGNALKFTSQGTVSLRAEVIRHDAPQVVLGLSVQDTGIGIPPDRKHRLFAPFSQVDGSTTRKFGGTGLGLAICRQLVELMGGSIEVESELGQGTTFSLLVPLEPAQEPLCTGSRPPALHGLRVFVADGRAASVAVLRELLGCWGMQVEEAAEGEDVVERLLRESRAGTPYAIAIVAHHLPEQDALALGQTIRVCPELAELAVILLDEVDGTLNRDECESRGAALVTKPIRQSKLYDSLITMLHGPRNDGGRPGTRRQAAEHTRLEQPYREPSPGPSVSTTLAGTKSRRVLVAEDNEINQLVTSEILRLGGFECELVATGKEAIAALQTAKFDLVLMDCQMPEMDGFDATRQIRKLESTGQLCEGTRRPMPIIALTANAVRGDREQCLAAGMNDYATKPVDREQLLRLIGTYFDGTEGAGESADDTPRDEPGHAPINIESLLTRCGGDEPFAQKLLVRFQDKLPRVLGDFTTAVEREEWSAVKRLAHTLKGTAGNLAAEPLCRAAAAVEQAVGAGQIGEAAKSLNQLEREADRCLVFLDELLAAELAGS